MMDRLPELEGFGGMFLGEAEMEPITDNQALRWPWSEAENSAHSTRRRFWVFADIKKTDLDTTRTAAISDVRHIHSCMNLLNQNFLLKD